jgi:RNA polymerase sigma-70 factor, ECF subfamily
MTQTVVRPDDRRVRPRRSVEPWREPAVRTDFAHADDAALVEALHVRDEAAMAEIVLRHRTPVVAFARRLTGDAHRAEEVAQEVFVRLWERAERFDADRGTLRAFLLALTHGRALDVVRSDTARRRREERDAARGDTTERGADAKVEASSVADAVRAALGSLPEEERRAVELAYFGGHSYRTVARLLDQPEGTVKGRIRAGLARLRAALDAQDLRD